MADMQFDARWLVCLQLTGTRGFHNVHCDIWLHKVVHHLFAQISHYNLIEA